MEVNAASLTITASSPSATYGGAVPGVTATYSGFVNGDSASALGTAPTCSTSATSGSPAGNYPTSCSGAVDPNYSISYVDGQATVEPATLVIAASSASLTYGGAAPSITGSYSGFVNGDDVSSLTTPPTCSTSVTSVTAVGSYSSACTGAVDGNYSITYIDGSVQVAPAPLTIMAPSETMVYGSAVPALGVSYSGFVDGDGVSSLTTPPTCSTTATSASPMGVYDTVCSGAVDSNYEISYVDGSMQVTAAALVVTASSGSLTYGGSVPAVTANLLGIREQRQRGLPHHAAHLLDDGHFVEPGRHLPEFVLRGCRRQLHDHLRRRRNRCDRRRPHGDGVLADHHLRGPRARHHGLVLGLRQRRRRVLAEHPARLFHGGHVVEPGWDLREYVFGSS